MNSFSIFLNGKKEQQPEAILSLIFSYIEPEDLNNLSNFRLVNSQWNLLIGKQFIFSFIPSISLNVDKKEIISEWKNEICQGLLYGTIGTVSLMCVPLTIASTGVALVITPFSKTNTLEFIKSCWLIQLQTPMVSIPKGISKIGSGLYKIGESSGSYVTNYVYSPVKDWVFSYFKEKEENIGLLCKEECELTTNMNENMNIIQDYF